MTAPPAPTIGLAEVLDALWYREGEFYQLCNQPPGQPFRSDVLTYEPISFPVPQDVNLWFSVNPTAGPERSNAGRGGAADVTRLAGIWVDLDVKPAGCPTIDAAMEIIDDLSVALGTPPTVLIRSGHGVQPIWAIDEGEIRHAEFMDGNPIERTDAAALLRRWGKLVANVADRRGCKVDSLYDLPRVLRVPGSMNVKDLARPVPATGTLPGGAPVSLERLREVLDEYGIPRLTEDGTDPGVIVSAPAEWTAADHSCKYGAELVKGWSTEQPAARHPWLVAQATRLASMRRNGCLTDADAAAAEQALVGRFQQLVTGSGDRGATPGEIRGALNWGVEAAATFTAEHLASELGNHKHLNEPLPLWAMPKPPPPPPPARHLNAVPDAGIIPAPPAVVHGNNVVALAPEPAPMPLRYSEDGLALELVARFADRIRYQPERKRWLHWSGTRWEWQTEGAAVWQLARAVARDIPDSKALESFKRRSLTANGVAGVLRHAAADDRIHVTVDQLDADPLTLNTPGGLVDLRTGSIRPSVPADLVTRCTTVSPDMTSPTPAIWDSFLTTTFGGDQELIRYVQQLAGLALIGDTREQIMPFWYGEGRNGKSTLIEVLRYVMGSTSTGYARSAPAEMLMARRFEGHSTELADIAGARLVLCSELEDGQKLAEARIKNLTSAEPITARFLYGQPFSYKPTFLVLLVSNHRPETTSGGYALWRRIRAVPFNHRVPDDEVDPDLAAKLEAVGPHILGWAVRGAVDYLANGMARSSAVVGATAEYQADQNNVSRFLTERCTVTGSHGSVGFAQMHDHYEKWCRTVGEEPLSRRRIVPMFLATAGITRSRSHGIDYYDGVVLSVSPTTAVPAPQTVMDLFGEHQ